MIDKKNDQLSTNGKNIELVPLVRKFDFGKVPVCKICGCSLLQCSPDEKCCGEVTTLKDYVENVRGEVFNESEWSFKTEVINATNIDLDAEVSVI